MDGINNLGIPAWASVELDKASVHEELKALREFFEAWKALHAIIDKRKKKQKMEAADVMVQKSILVKKIQNV